MTVFEPGSSGVGNDRSADSATTTAHDFKMLHRKFLEDFLSSHKSTMKDSI